MHLVGFYYKNIMMCCPHQISFGLIRSRKMRWTGYIAGMRKRRCAYRVLVGKPEEGKLEDPGIDGRILLRRIFREWDVGV